MRQGEGARDGGWRVGMADVGERDVEKEVELQLAVRGGGCWQRWSGRRGWRRGWLEACRRWRGWRCGGPEAVVAAA